MTPTSNTQGGNPIKTPAILPIAEPTETKAVPNFLAFSIAFSSFNKSVIFLTAFAVISNIPASAMTSFNSRQESCIIDIPPTKEVFKSSVAPFILAEPSPNISKIIFLVSFPVFLTPASKPSIWLIPPSLNISAEAIPDANALCNCLPVSTKLKPETAAISPVISSNSFNSSTPSATVNNEGVAASISSSVNGTLFAKAFIMSNALEASSTLPVKNFKRICKLSTEEAVVIIDLSTAPAPRPIKAPCTDIILFFTPLAALPIVLMAFFAFFAPVIAPLGSTFTPRVAIWLVAIIFFL